MVYGFEGSKSNKHLPMNKLTGCTKQNNWHRSRSDDDAEKLPKDGKSLILSGDVPLIGVDTLQHLTTTKSRFAMLTHAPDPFGGAYYPSQTEKVIAIVEEKGANDSQRQVTGN